MPHTDEVDLAGEGHGVSASSEVLSEQRLKRDRVLEVDKESPDQKWVEIKMGDLPSGDSEGHEADMNGSEHAPGTTLTEQGNQRSSPERVPSPSGMSDAQQPPVPPDKDLPEPVASSPATTNPYVPTVNDASSQSRPRSDTQSTAATINGQRLAPLSSIVFVVQALEQIAASKEARRKKEIGEAVKKALATIKQKDRAPDPETIFDALRIATETSSIPLTTTSLDCIGKLISYSYFSIPPSNQDPDSPPEQRQQPPLIERAIETICDCFQDEATPAEIQLQIVKSLLAAVLNDKIIVHGAGLLKAVRQIFNIFLLSKSTANQQVAQGTLTQMVDTVFERVRTRLAMKEARLDLSRLPSEKGTANGSQVDVNGIDSVTESGEANGGMEVDDSSETNSTLTVDRPVLKVPGEKLTLQSLENAKGFDDARIGDNAPTMVTKAKLSHKGTRNTSAQQSANGDEGESPDDDEEDEIYVKDAFLVFRSMCRLSTKQLSQDQQQDIKSSNMRSKLVSLAIIRTVLNNNIVVFTSPLVTIRSSTSNEPTGFGQAINHYLRISLSKNGASSMKQVFEPCCEIFWLMLKYMRVMLKVCTLIRYVLTVLCN